MYSPNSVLTKTSNLLYSGSALLIGKLPFPLVTRWKDFFILGNKNVFTFNLGRGAQSLFLPRVPKNVATPLTGITMHFCLTFFKCSQII